MRARDQRHVRARERSECASRAATGCEREIIEAQKREGGPECASETPTERFKVKDL